MLEDKGLHPKNARLLNRSKEEDGKIHHTWLHTLLRRQSGDVQAAVTLALNLRVEGLLSVRALQRR